MSKYSREINLGDSNAADTKIIHLVGKNKKVLEFGCAGGHMSKVLKEKCGCEVVGVEINAQDAEMARAYCKDVIVGDIEDLAWCEKLAGAQFDVAIFADVLEHLKRPERPLEKVREFLKDNGCVLVSVPNIANVSIRLELLSGGFQYEELGILDDTHLKYFTLKSIINLIESAKLYVDSVDYSTKDLPDKVIAEQLKPLGLRATKKTLKNFSALDAVAYEFILKANKRKPKGYVQYKFKEIKKPQRIMEEVFGEQAKQNREKGKHIANLEAGLLDYKRHAQSLESERSDRERHIANIEKERKALEPHIKNLEKEVKERQAHISNLEADLSDGKSHIKNIEARLLDQKKHIKTLESERSDRKRHIANIEKERKDREVHVKNLEADLSDLREHAGNLESALIDRKEHISNLEVELADRKKHISNLETLRVDRDQHIANLENMAIDREGHLADIESELKGKVAHVSHLEKELYHGERAIERLKHASTQFEQEIKGLKAELDKKRGRIARLEDEGDKREQEIERLETQIDALEKTNERLSGQINQLEASASWRVTRPFRAVSGLSTRTWKSARSFWKP